MQFCPKKNFEISRSVCKHEEGNISDPSGRSCCTICGEVLQDFGELILDHFPFSPEYQYIPKLSSLDASLSFTIGVLIDRVCDECEKTLGLTFSSELRQRMMLLMDKYRGSLKIVASYENLVRASAIVVLRQAGYVFPLKKLGSTAVLRVVKKLSSGLPVSVLNVDRDVLFTSMLEKLGMLNFGVSQLNEFANIMCEYGPYPALLLPSHACAICYYVMNFEKMSFRQYIKAVGYCECEKTCYRDLKLLKEFVSESLALVGVRKGANFFDHKAAIVKKLKNKAKISRILTQV